ncbi:MAG: hypothetical protein GY867_01770 [bacterium]|nr:hypothetical protein [bacterium]
MHNVWFSVLFILVVIPSTISASGYWGTGNDKYDVAGNLKIEQLDGDSVLAYDVVVTGFVPDSVRIWGLGRYDFVLDTNEAINESSSRNLRYRFKGAGGSNTSESYANPWGQVRAYGMEGNDTVCVEGGVRLRTYAFKLNLSLFGWGYGEAALPDGETRRSPMFSGEFGFNVPMPRADFYALVSSLTNFGGRRAFHHEEFIPAGLRVVPFGRTDFYPSVVAAIQYSNITVKRSQATANDQQWGGQFGLRIDTPFERFYYSYSTSIGGYHRAGVFVKGYAAGFAQGGTRYEYIRLDGADLFRVQFQFEGLGWDHGEGEDLERPNTRPWWHKGLAFGGALPFLPIAWVISLFED